MENDIHDSAFMQHELACQRSKATSTEYETTIILFLFRILHFVIVYLEVEDSLLFGLNIKPPL